jgi:maleate cis-trans isomerase
LRSRLPKLCGIRRTLRALSSGLRAFPALVALVVAAPACGPSEARHEAGSILVAAASDLATAMPELAHAFTEATGIPTGTAFSAQVEAMRRMGGERYTMVSPYEPAMNDAIAKTLAGVGFDCVHAHGLNITDNVKLGDLTRQELRDHVLAAARPADVILVPCTNYAVGWVVDELEAKLGIPIIDSVLLAIWEGFRLAQVPTPVEGWGQFMAGHWN